MFDPTLGRSFSVDTEGTPRHRLVAIGDSLTHGFQSGAVFNTDLSYPAIIAKELGWFDEYRYPRYGGHGGCRSTSSSCYGTSRDASDRR